MKTKNFKYSGSRVVFANIETVRSYLYLVDLVVEDDEVDFSKSVILDIYFWLNTSGVISGTVRNL